MSLLVAVKSCLRDLDRGCHDVIRATWGQNLRSSLRFFVGAEPNSRSSHILKSDEIQVEAADDYHSLPFKTRAICQWAYPKNITHLFICDTDTFVNVNKLMSCGYERYDYVGKISRPIGETFPYEAVNRSGVPQSISECHPWASGGFGYFLSREALGLVADKFPNTWAEDLWVGQVLGPHFQKGELLALDLPANSYSSHFPSTQFGGEYDPKYQWMEMMQAAL
jgi:hypothetical protein